MSDDFLCPFLAWSLAFNYSILLIWFMAFVFARSWMRKIHGKWFALSESAFDAMHYGGMAIYKIGILLFNLAPLAALYLSRGGH